MGQLLWWGSHAEQGVDFDFEQCYILVYNKEQIKPDVLLGKSDPLVQLYILWNLKQFKVTGISSRSNSSLV